MPKQTWQKHRQRLHREAKGRSLIFVLVRATTDGSIAFLLAAMPLSGVGRNVFFGGHVLSALALRSLSHFRSVLDSIVLARRWAKKSIHPVIDSLVVTNVFPPTSLNSHS
jgi:hypothetical protein